MQYKTSTFKVFCLCLVSLLAGFGLSENTYAESLKLKNVVLNKKTLFLDTEESVTFKFNVNQPATVSLNIYDARNLLIYQDKKTFNSDGDGELTWSGTNSEGQKVAPESYLYTLEASNNSSDKTTYDLSDITGGQPLVIEDGRYDLASGKVNFSVFKTGRYFLRVGLQDAFIAKTIVNGAILTPGDYSIDWDGRDKKAVISIGENPNLRIYGEGYRLSDNTIVVTSKAYALDKAPEWSTPDENAIFRVAKERKPGFSRLLYHSVEYSKDFDIELLMPELDANSQRGGVPVISDKTTLRVTASDYDSYLIETQRAEVVFFLGTNRIYGNETSHFPYNWKFDPADLPDGTHYLTAFIASFGGHFGSLTKEIVIKKK